MRLALFYLLVFAWCLVFGPPIIDPKCNGGNG